MSSELLTEATSPPQTRRTAKKNRGTAATATELHLASELAAVRDDVARLIQRMLRRL